LICISLFNLSNSVIELTSVLYYKYIVPSKNIKVTLELFSIYFWNFLDKDKTVPLKIGHPFSLEAAGVIGGPPIRGIIW
jgi:hypothetical protein